MYLLDTREETVRIPPNRLGEPLDQVTYDLACQAFEGRMDHQKRVTVLVTKLKLTGPGVVVHSDGAVYQPVIMESLLFKPSVQEVIEGFVCEVVDFGAFIRFGPLDALLHVSQVTNDHIKVDVGGQRLVAKDTKRDMRLEDVVRARVVTISLNEQSPRESKIGLTMRQPGLGKLDWITEDREKALAPEGKAKGKGKGKGKGKAAKDTAKGDDK